MGRVSAETIEKLNNFISSLPEEAKGKCVLCNQTLVHIVKQAEVQTGAGTATVTSALADNINKTAAPNDKVTSNSLRQKAISEAGQKSRKHELLKSLLTAVGRDLENHFIYFARDIRNNDVFKIGRSISPESRINQFNGYAEKKTWELIKKIEFPALAASDKTETHIHKEFEHFRVTNELFKIDCLDEAIKYTNTLASDLYSSVAIKSISSLGTNKTINELEEQAEKEILKQAKELNADKAKKKREKKLQEYNNRVEVAKHNKVVAIVPNLILIDPPWKYRHTKTENRKIENHYNTETNEEIATHLPETEDNCIMFLWATAPKLEEAVYLMKKWGFDYRTCAVWDKEIMGMGYWFRGQHELLLVGVKGDVSPPLEDFRVASVFREKRTEHSKKPECVYEWIEESFGDKIKLEMYCRSPRNGWQSWGNEI